MIKTNQKLIDKFTYTSDMRLGTSGLSTNFEFNNVTVIDHSYMTIGTGAP